MLVRGRAGSGGTTELSQNGITWVLQGTPTTGQFWNGDYYFVGPATVLSQSPAWDGTKNGAMVNPTGGGSTQGYDTRPSFTYAAGVRATFPLAMSPGDSLVSVIGRTSAAGGGANEVLNDAAVLTCLASAPASPSTTFRPPYVAGSKPLWTQADVDYDLPSIVAVPSGTSVPTFANIITATSAQSTALLSRVWLDHGANPTNLASCHPTNNMPPYPRDSSHALGLLALKCFITHGERTETINRLVQHGIDQYAISLTNDEGWKAYGGFGNGRKWPILFAGLVLDDSSMQSPPLMVNDNSVFKFGEDGHTYQGDTQPLWGQDCAVDGINSPWFSNHDCRDPDGVVEADPNPYRDDEGMVNDGGYRICCTSHTWVCSALAARLMGAVTTWNHTPFFDYMDRWVAEPLCFFDSSTEAKQDLYGYGGTQNLFAKKMWEDYR